MAQKPSIPKGTRDFTPAIMAKRNFIFNTIKATYQRFGYQPIETPAMENLSTLMGKYGEEGDKLLFKILNSGNYLAKAHPEHLENKDSTKLTASISDKGLRYDLTVPFARYVVQHRNDITFPFKRYQLQPVWRADRPQKGRYREFYQCDADVIGTNSLLNEVELVQIIDAVFTELNIRVEVKINNRKILAGIAEIIGHPDKIIDITVAIDKLDKIGLDKVNEELAAKGLPADAIAKLQPILHLEGSNQEKLQTLKTVLTDSAIGQKGIEELETVFELLNTLPINNLVQLDLTLARGLNYYTGAIFEVKALDAKIGSICGGGRYDDLTGIFGLPNVSGVGISFGADRIFDVLTDLDGFPKAYTDTSKVLFINFGLEEQAHCLPLLAKIREAGLAAEMYPDAGAKMKKQMNYANNKGIPFVILIGENEMQKNLLTLKNMETGEQKTIGLSEAIQTIQAQ